MWLTLPESTMAFSKNKGGVRRCPLMSEDVRLFDNFRGFVRVLFGFCSVMLWRGGIFSEQRTNEDGRKEDGRREDGKWKMGEKIYEGFAKVRKIFIY